MATLTKTIRLTGLSNNPNDLTCDDGNLAVASGLVHEGGSLRPFYPVAPSAVISFTDVSDSLSYAGQPYGHRVIHVHETPSFPNVIVTYSVLGNDYQELQKIGWLPKPSSHVTDPSLTELYIPDQDVKNVVSIGRTLIIYTSKSQHYFLFAPDTSSYRYLGSHLPELEISFGLYAHPHRNSDDIDRSDDDYLSSSDNLYRDLDRFTLSSGYQDKSDYVLDQDDSSRLTEAAMAASNRFVNGWGSDNGYFTQPFFVRAALRMYDGSVTMHTAPIYMRVSTTANPLITVMHMRNNNVWLDAEGIGCELKYWITEQCRKALLEDWSDIITSVDIFVSQPLYTYDQSGVCKSFHVPYVDDSDVLHLPNVPIEEKRFDNSVISAFADKQDSDTIITEILQSKENFIHSQEDISLGHRLSDNQSIAGLGGNPAPIIAGPTLDSVGDHAVIIGAIEEHAFSSTYHSSRRFQLYDPRYYPLAYVDMPKIPNIDEIVRTTSTFYLLSSISTYELSSAEDGNVIKVDKDKLKNIVTHELMTDDFESHHDVIPDIAFPYNGRLNIASCTKKMFDGFTIDSMSQRCKSALLSSPMRVTTIVTLQTSYGKIEVSPSSLSVIRQLQFCYFFYPDPAAKLVKFIVHKNYIDGTAYYVAECPLREHESLNAAYIYDNDGIISGSRLRRITEQEYIDLVAYANSLQSNPSIADEPSVVRTSEVNNPFVYSAANTEQVGTGRVLALSAAVLPISEGQYGDTPMYCFTTEGIWALKPNSTGSWLVEQPVSYDVLSDPRSLLRLESSILFTTSRGLMHIAGGKVECTSDVFRGPYDRLLSGEAYMPQYHDMSINFVQNTVPSVCNASLYFDDTPFHDFISGAAFVYDYPHQRIIIGRHDKPYSYVYSITDRLWSTAPVCITSRVDSFPEAYAMIRHEGNLMMADFASMSDVISVQKPSFIITRPIKLDDTSFRKTIRTVNVCGQFHRSHCSIILLGCPDNALHDWYVISSCRGSRLPFRFGSPYRYFRIAIASCLDPEESIDHVTVEYEIKEQRNKFRQ